MECDYDLHAWVVMANHAHWLISPRVDVPVLMRRRKGGSAREANQLLGQTGKPFWQDEGYDHLVRNTDEFHRLENYILENPVRAGLARSVEEYPLVRCPEARRDEARPTVYNTVILERHRAQPLNGKARAQRVDELFVGSNQRRA